MSAERHKRVKEIFLEVCDLAPEERAAFLASACAEDPSLRPEVEEMLAFEEGESSFLDATEAVQATSSTTSVLQRLEEQMDASERYEIQGEFARGGMGAILRVWDADLQRALAMKVILPSEAEDPDDAGEAKTRSLARFLEEAQVTGQLDHPGIVPVHELGLDSNGRVYFTMKLVKAL